MPTYEFRCPKGHDFEKFYRSIGSAPSEVHCPECGALAERQLSGGAGLVFKGSGFYITDYGKDGKKDQKAPVASGTASTEKSGTEKSDAGSSKSESSGSTATDSKPSSESKSSSADSKPAAKPASPRKKDTK